MTLTPVGFHVKDSHLQVSTYQLEHWQVGRGGTVLTLQVQVERGLGRVTTTVPDMRPHVDGDDVEVALDKLASWMERAAEALRNRGSPKPVLCAYEK
jgi:hypothetical protein